MPFYEYQCTKCDHRLEVLQKISDEPLVYCPVCNEASLKKLISAAAFHLKGTGWYQTDFKNDNKAKDKVSADKANTASSDNSNGDAKTETKSGDSSVKSETAKGTAAAKNEASASSAAN